MHAIFMLYGKLEEVNLLIRDMSAHKHYLKMWKGKKKMVIPIESQVRMLPGGVYEYVCPKEDMDTVLNTLRFNEPNPYNVPNGILKIVNRILKLKPIPKFKTTHKFLWLTENVGIIPLGIREDRDIIEPKGARYEGWEHEGI